MNDIEILDNFVDDREFRNYIISLLLDNGYRKLKIDDERISDKIKENDNDFLVTKDNITYTVQTYLNKEITFDEIDETLRDITKEKTLKALIVTNKEVSNEEREKLSDLLVDVVDRNDLKNMIK